MPFLGQHQPKKHQFRKNTKLRASGCINIQGGVVALAYGASKISFYINILHRDILATHCRIMYSMISQ